MQAAYGKNIRKGRGEPSLLDVSSCMLAYLGWAIYAAKQGNLLGHRTGKVLLEVDGGVVPAGIEYRDVKRL